MKKLVLTLWIVSFLLAVGCTDPDPLDQITVVEKVVVVTQVVKVTATFPPATATEESQPDPTTEPTEKPTDAPAPTQTPRPTTAQTEEIQLLVEAANLRSAPGTQSDILGIVKSGEPPELLGQNAGGSWLKVRTVAGRVGWIGSNVVQLNKDVNLKIVDTATSAAASESSQSVSQAQASPIPPSPTALPATNTPPIETPIPSPTDVPIIGETAFVVKVVDGDTIDVNIGGRVERLRYIGIDTPEYNEPCGSEATQANAALVAGKTVQLVRDITERDKYGRLLRYVYVGDMLVEAELVRQGWAEAYRYEPDTAQAAYLESLQAQAPVRNCGFSAQPPFQPDGSNCDPAYPTVCIPPPPPDLDCRDVPYKRFQVLPPDPHNFDGNHDGEGCEK